MLYPLIRKFFFALDAETAHGIGMRGTSFLDASGLACLLTRPVTPCPVAVMGLDFPNPVGLAAGLDKNGDHIDALARLGFGFIEIGTVTPRPQPGNPRPRLFRIPEAQGIINRMGFNNDGVDKLLENVRAARFPKQGGILGINIGKNATTPIENAADDYLTCLDKVYADASYVAVNISSPNTKNLRELQKDEALDDLLAQLKARQEILADRHGNYVPLALKIAPDLDDEQIVAIADALRRHRMDGVIATNTTLSRDGVEGMANADEAGGLSGRARLPPVDRCTEKAVGSAGRRGAGNRRRRHPERRRRGREDQGRGEPGAVLQRLHLPRPRAGQRGRRHTRTRLEETQLNPYFHCGCLTPIKAG